jgi:hypothetical protein
MGLYYSTLKPTINLNKLERLSLAVTSSQVYIYEQGQEPTLEIAPLR